MTHACPTRRLSVVVGVGSAEVLLGIPAADVKAGDACGLFQHHASFGGLGRDDGGDLALAYERRAMCARGGIGEDQRHVLGSHIAAIGAISAAGAALAPANDPPLPLLPDGNGPSVFVRFPPIGQASWRERGWM